MDIHYTAEDIANIILTAKLGSCRKAAQIGSCEPFAAALIDAASAFGVKATPIDATFEVSGSTSWAHAGVKIGDTIFDSKGIFNHEIVRKRLGIHRNVETELKIKANGYHFEVDEESVEYHAHCLKALKVSWAKHVELMQNQTQDLPAPA